MNGERSPIDHPRGLRPAAVLAFGVALALALAHTAVGPARAAPQWQVPSGEADAAGAADPRAPSVALVRPAPQAPPDWPLEYAAARRAVPVHTQPGVGPPQRHLDPAGRWVAVESVRTLGEQLWYAVTIGGWVPSEAVAPRPLSRFEGIAIGPDTPRDIGFVTAGQLNVRPKPRVADDSQPVTRLTRYDIVRVLEARPVDGGDTWYRVGDGRWVHGAYVRRVPWTHRPAGVAPDEKWVDVDLTQQTLVAYEGDRPVYATLVATGLPRSPTWEGLDRIWVKLERDRMVGGDRSIPGDYYWLDDVPYVMYFHADYGLHGTYWHDDFGRRKSHGCVNLSTKDAGWLYRWTTPTVPQGRRSVLAGEDDRGTWVWTHR